MGALRLNLYLATLAARRLSAVVCLLVAVYAAIDAAEARSLAPPGGGASVWRSYPLRLPGIATHVLPLAATLGALLALGTLRRQGEWEALLGAGLAPGRLVLALAAGPLLAAVAMAPLALEAAPRANAAWARRVLPPADAAGGPEHRWIVLEGGSLARMTREGGGWTPTAVADLPGATHRGRYLRIPADGAGPVATGSMELARRAVDRLAGHDEPPAAAWSGLAGQSLTGARLDAAIAARRSAGLDTAALESERALRLALILACALLPVLGLLLAVAGGLVRTGALTALALGLGVGYWLLTAVAWNGAAAGAWPAAWICPGVPAVFATASLAALACLRGSVRPPATPR